MTNHHTPTNRRTGMSQASSAPSTLLSTAPLNLTPYCCSSPARSGSTRVVLNLAEPLGSFSLSVPSTYRSETLTSATLPSRRYCWNSLYGIAVTDTAAVITLCRSSTPNNADRAYQILSRVFLSMGASSGSRHHQSAGQAHGPVG